MKRLAIALVAACVAMPALAEDVGVGVRVGPVGVGVGTTGSRPTTVIREREVVREREPSDKTVIIKKDRDPDPDVVVKKKTIIRD